MISQRALSGTSFASQSTATPSPTLAISTVDTLGTIWSALHRHLEVIVSRRDLHCLRMAAFAMDDDMLSQLLLRKIRGAQIVEDTPPDTAAICSTVDFTFGGERARVRLSRPSDRSGGLSIASRFGAALIGLQNGQSILWPADCGRLQAIKLNLVTDERVIPSSTDTRLERLKKC